MNKQVDLLQGTLDPLILQTLTLEPMHGCGVTRRIRQISEGALRVNQGSPYPALPRLEQQDGLLRMGRLREQSSGEILPAHPRRAKTKVR